jgi:hypothetical protein
MSNFPYAILFLTLFAKAELYAQPQRFIVKPLSFSSGIFDEFSPVYYNGGIVFCSNQSDNSIISYNNNQNRLFKIFYVTKKGNTGWSQPKILAREITTALNDGPATFNVKGNIMYYSRNNSIENSLRNISDTSNKLGIYSAELIDGRWTNIKPFRYNNPLYTFCTPALTPEFDRIYFASDMPGGSGGMDLYYCDRVNNDWDKPVNMGPLINTQKNESFPFACRYGKLYFASDGHQGFGGKDLYYTIEINREWIAPVHLDSALNSSSDDFGIAVDSTFENGYFSTNRRKTDDIFSFSSAPVEFTSCDSIKENNYCFTFYDERQRLIDTVPVIYQWDFGDGMVRIGREVKHCFPGPGDYSVKLSITDELTGNAIADKVEYNFTLENIKQAYINSNNVGIVDKSISFEGLITDLKGYMITDFLWDFGNGFKPGGQKMSTTFKKKGDYTIKLGLLAEKDSLGIVPKICVMKKIRIYDNFQELALGSKRSEGEINTEPVSALNQDNTIQLSVYLMDDLSGRQKSKIEEALKGSGESTVKYDKYGINPSSDKFLDKVAGVLKENPDIRLEIVLHSLKDEIKDNRMPISETWARELSFYFKNKDVDMNAVHSKGFDQSHQIFKPFIPGNRSIDGEIKFIFMKK